MYLETDGQTMERTDDFASLLEVLVKSLGSLYSLVKKDFC